MARRKGSRRQSLIGWVLGAAVLGSVIGAVIFYNPGTPLPGPDDVQFGGKYDDSWGKLPTAETHVSVEQILVSWKGANANVKPKDANRTKEEARKLIDQLWARYKNNPTRANFEDLQTQYNEDSEPHTIYSIPNPKRPGDPNGGFVKPFADCAKTTREGFARIVESQFGFHLIRRLKSGR